MKLKYLYGWWVGKKAAFVNSFGENEQLRAQAETFWRHLESGTLFYILAFIIVAVLLAYLYFKPFNDMPGRHFRPRYWVIFGVISMVASFVLTLGIAYFTAAPKLQGTWPIELKLSLANCVYTGLLYFTVVSICFWNFSKTNAYKFIKL